MNVIASAAASEANASPEGEAPLTSPFEGPVAKRLAREWETMESMVRCYCRGHHEPASALCGECADLLGYAKRRLERCRFGVEKPTCAKCPVHCYQPPWRDRIKTVMRYAGPRLLWRHPILSLAHWWDGYRKPPVAPARKESPRGPTLTGGVSPRTPNSQS